jgi:hypothetical protein
LAPVVPEAELQLAEEVHLMQFATVAVPLPLVPFPETITDGLHT